MPLDARIAEKAARILALSDADLCRTCSGAYGTDKQRMLLNDLRDVLEIMMSEKPKGFWGT